MALFPGAHNSTNVVTLGKMWNFYDTPSLCFFLVFVFLRGFHCCTSAQHCQHMPFCVFLTIYPQYPPSAARSRFSVFSLVLVWSGSSFRITKLTIMDFLLQQAWRFSFSISFYYWHLVWCCMSIRQFDSCLFFSVLLWPISPGQLLSLLYFYTCGSFVSFYWSRYVLSAQSVENSIWMAGLSWDLIQQNDKAIIIYI